MSGVYTVTAPDGRKANVSGTIYHNLKVVEGEEYDSILWLTDHSDINVVYEPELQEHKVLVIYEKDFRKAYLMQSLGFYPDVN